jgi:catechol 2,3-dioxygenase-like lactoylglutathione lyase family enzyme
VFDRVTVHASDREASERFYARVLAPLRMAASDFAVEQAHEAVTRGLHIGFVAPSRTEVDEFWRVGTAARYRDDGEPGPRPQYRYDYYGAFLLDPDGNSAEAVHHGALRRGGAIDHLWIRVADVGASKRFYAELAARAGFRLATERPDYARFAGASGSFSVLAGPPTENLEMAFTATDVAAQLTDPDGNRVELVKR